jgi:hypothetical protein
MEVTKEVEKGERRPPNLVPQLFNNCVWFIANVALLECLHRLLQFDPPRRVFCFEELGSVEL